jgi:hypothetical protein
LFLELFDAVSLLLLYFFPGFFLRFDGIKTCFLFFLPFGLRLSLLTLSLKFSCFFYGLLLSDFSG